MAGRAKENVQKGYNAQSHTSERQSLHRSAASTQAISGRRAARSSDTRSTDTAPRQESHHKKRTRSQDTEGELSTADDEESEDSESESAPRRRQKKQSKDLSKRPRYVEDDEESENSESESPPRRHRKKKHPKKHSKKRSKRSRYADDDEEPEDSESESPSRRRRQKKQSRDLRKRSRYVEDDEESEDSESRSPPRRYRKKKHSTQRPKKRSKRARYVYESSSTDDEESEDSDSRSPPRRRPYHHQKKRPKKLTRRSRCIDQDGEDEFFQDMAKELLDGELQPFSKILQNIPRWMKVNLTPITEDMFRSIAKWPGLDADFTREVYFSLKRQWMEHPARDSALGRSTPQTATAPSARPPKDPLRGERESFMTLYRFFPRFHEVLYEEFMGPRYKLAYDNGSNQPVYFSQDLPVVIDPLPSKRFSESLRALALHGIWRGKLDFLATCMQYINILRTNDRRPWSVINCDTESIFFETWNQVVLENRGSQERIDELFSKVKDRMGGRTGFYCHFFSQMNDSFKAKFQPQLDNMMCKRQSDDDPYFISAMDLTILTHAVDNSSVWDYPLYGGVKFTSKVWHSLKSGNDYPSVKDFEAARDLAILTTLSIAKKEALARERERLEGGSPPHPDTPPRIETPSSQAAALVPAAQQKTLPAKPQSPRQATPSRPASTSESESALPRRGLTERDRRAMYIPGPQSEDNGSDENQDEHSNSDDLGNWPRPESPS
ncbi:hypothetical protein F5Y05DRAFT_418916 [Hypoxylon sp. FL0543]|nr:hypothetical protein F5Y05DRAFT_418916 [Hypoxylon sp. FL0543]